MIHYVRLLGSAILLLLASLVAHAQDPDLEGKLDEEMLTEVTLTDQDTQTLLLDNSRSKIGRDFYEAFYRHYVSLPKTAPPQLLPINPGTKADSTAKPNALADQDMQAFVVTLDELPAPGIGTALLSITLNDQLIWQNYVQLRQELIETYAQNAAETLNQYVLNYQELQRQLVSEDQQGTGIFD